MPFSNKTFTQILTNEITHLAATGPYSDFNTGSAIRTLAESHSLVVDEAYFQLVNLLSGFYLNTASGSDLDRRASDFGLQRKLSIPASAVVTFSGTGSPTIPAGTLVAAPASGNTPQIIFITTQAGTIGTGITAIAQVSGSIGNVPASTITTIITNPNPALITSVTNSSPATGGIDQEADNTFRARIQTFLQSFSKGTVNSIISAAINVNSVSQAIVLQNFTITGYQLTPSVTDLANGGTLNPSSLPGTQTGNIVVVIDNGTGSLPSSIVPTVQNILLGSTTDPVNFPGYVPVGVQLFTSRPSTTTVNVAFTIHISSTVLDTTALQNSIISALTLFINQKPIGSVLFLAEIVDQVMNVTGVTDVIFSTVLLNGSNADLSAATPAIKFVPGTITITIS